jgi:hypothetical protein
MRLPRTVKWLMSVILLAAIMLNGLLGMGLCHDEANCGGEEKVTTPHCACEHGEEAASPLLSVSNLGDCGRSCACVPVQQSWRGTLISRSVEQPREKAFCKESYRPDFNMANVPPRESIYRRDRPAEIYHLSPSLVALRTVVLLT